MAKKSMIAFTVGNDVLQLLNADAERISSPRSYIARKIIKDYYDKKELAKEA